jgi:hypothetical protein
VATTMKIVVALEMAHVVAPFDVSVTVDDGRGTEELVNDSIAGKMVGDGEINVENPENVKDKVVGSIGGEVEVTTDVVGAAEIDSTVEEAEVLNDLKRVNVCAGFDDGVGAEVDEMAPTVIVDKTVAVATGLPLVATEDGMEMDDVAAESGVLKEPVIPSILGARGLGMLCMPTNGKRHTERKKRKQRKAVRHSVRRM